MDWKLVWMAFGTLFLAELGDKTQLTVITLTAQHQKIGSIFLGAAAALVVVTLLGVIAGNWIKDKLPTSAIQTVAGLLFVGMGIKTLVEAVPEFLSLFK